MQLLIDQGNSLLKWCLCCDNKFMKYHIGSLNDLENDLKIETDKIQEVLVCCVKKEIQLESLVNRLQQYFSVPIQVARTAEHYQGLKNSYNVTSQMGVDRWLAMVAAWQRIRNGFIVVDAGSALTLDIVDNTGLHLGGHIVPGLALQKKILHQDTDRVNIDEQFTATAYEPGTSTDAAVQNGCLSVLSSYIEAMYKKNATDEFLPLILTGGDAATLSEGLDIKHKLIPGLVLEGLHYSFLSID